LGGSAAVFRLYTILDNNIINHFHLRVTTPKPANFTANFNDIGWDINTDIKQDILKGFSDKFREKPLTNP